jgi:hypothetical protein
MPTVLPLAAAPTITQNTDVKADKGPDAIWSYWGASITVSLGATRPPRPPRQAAAPVPTDGPLPPGASGQIVGRVADTEGKPVAGAELRVAGGPKTSTDAAGVFTLTDVPAGAVQITILANGFAPAEEGVSVAPGHDAELVVSLKRSAAPMLANVKGQVRTTSGDPVNGATVTILEVKSVDRADERGVFQIRVPAGRYTLRFEAPGFLTQTKVIDVSPGDQALFFIDLARKSVQ